MQDVSAGITEQLAAWSQGDSSALEKLLPRIERELHQIAHRQMRRARPGHTLQTTALLNEAYLHLVDDPKRSWQNRTHFVAAAAQISWAFAVASLILPAMALRRMYSPT